MKNWKEKPISQTELSGKTDEQLGPNVVKRWKRLKQNEINVMKTSF